MTSLLGRIHNVRRLRLSLLGFVFALGTPALALIYYSLSELKWETFHQQRNLAFELTDRINFKINHWVETEEQRAYSDYQFNGGGPANYFQPSPLSAIKLTGTLPGAIGYFQVGANGEFSSPVLPGNYVDAARYGISSKEYKQREVLKEQILQILLDNQLLQTQQTAPEPEPMVVAEDVANTTNSDRQAQTNSLASAPQAGIGLADSAERALARSPAPSPQTSQVFDQRLREQKQESLTVGNLDQGNVAFDKLKKTKPSADTNTDDAQLLSELDIANNLQEAAKRRMSEPVDTPEEHQRLARKEQSVVLEMREAQTMDKPPASDALQDVTTTTTPPRVTMFESEIYPFEFSPLNSGHLVFYRKVWREGALIIQGLVLDKNEFLEQTIGHEYTDTLLAATADLTVVFRGNIMASYRDGASMTTASPERGGELLQQSRLVAPFNDIELLFTINKLPVGPSALVVRWSAVVMALVLALGTWFIYRLGLRQMRLAQQQQDFVSAVSHELKTPLTSIRMYGEMLREGWADENKKRQYYDYIYDESERLSRLIANVLQLARMNRQELDLNVKAYSLNELIDNLRSKLHSQIERSGFEFDIQLDANITVDNVLADKDSFLQVFINLVDNALKFAAKGDIKKITLKVTQVGNEEVLFTLRDYGPGIDKRHLAKIFDLFYRAENELTRETVGTGIGLALVKQLVQSMGGRVEARNREPGAEFGVFLRVSH